MFQSQQYPIFPKIHPQLNMCSQWGLAASTMILQHHSVSDQYDMSGRDRWFALFIDPPVIEGTIRVNEESLLR